MDPPSLQNCNLNTPREPSFGFIFFLLQFDHEFEQRELDAFKALPLRSAWLKRPCCAIRLLSF